MWDVLCCGHPLLLQAQLGGNLEQAISGHRGIPGLRDYALCIPMGRTWSKGPKTKAAKAAGTPRPQLSCAAQQCGHRVGLGACPHGTALPKAVL